MRLRLLGDRFHRLLLNLALGFRCLPSCLGYEGVLILLALGDYLPRSLW